ncbi:nitric oxide synthase oxygenase [Paenibacillus sp. strain BS8-2]
MNITTISHTLYTEAAQFLSICYRELGRSDGELQARLESVMDEINIRGTYTHTAAELEHGAKLAWRNSNKCIGRLFWDTLTVVDARETITEEAFAEMLFSHIEKATDGGSIRPYITIFAPLIDQHATTSGPRIWNHQFIRYAGYQADDGVVIGDPSSILFTKFCESLGWQSAGTPFDVLPLVFQLPGHAPALRKIPERFLLEVPIRHAGYPDFDKHEVKWYAVPFLSDMTLEIGGIHYSAAPFNGWYMGTEIGARNLADENRYNLLPAMARAMGQEISKSNPLWKDRALVELNAAVLDSFRERGVTIVDHHTAALQFGRFEKNEHNAGRELTGRWSWLVPPLSPATTAIFHSSYNDTEHAPRFYARETCLP